MVGEKLTNKIRQENEKIRLKEDEIFYHLPSLSHNLPSKIDHHPLISFLMLSHFLKN